MITSNSNSQVKNVIQLLKKTKVRDKQDVFVVEGLKMFLEAPKENVVTVFVSQGFYGKDENREYLSGVKFEIVEDKVFDHMSDTRTPQGVLCVLKQFHYSLEDIIGGENPLVLILEDLQDPGNLGTIIRTGEGTGIGGVILSGNSVDVYNPKTIRATMGAIYRVPFLYVDKIQNVLPKLREKRIRTYAAHLEGERLYDEEDYKAGTAFFIGNEGKGLRDELAGKADLFVKIPMKGEVESLNVAVAASVLMYEVSRQRRSH